MESSKQVFNPPPAMVSTQISFAVKFERVEGDWIQAQAIGAPGVITVAPTHKQALEMIVDALQEYFRSLYPNAMVR